MRSYARFADRSRDPSIRPPSLAQTRGGETGGHVSRGPLPQGWLPDQGLEDPRGAEVHLVLNDHGPKLPEYMPGMIRTYRAGCKDEGLPAIFPASAKADGEPGPNTCTLWQVAFFE